MEMIRYVTFHEQSNHIQPLINDYRAKKINHYWPQVLFCASFPFMLYKQYVNVVQFVQASKQIAQGDLEERRRSRSSQRRREE